MPMGAGGKGDKGSKGGEGGKEGKWGLSQHSAISNITARKTAVTLSFHFGVFHG